MSTSAEQHQDEATAVSEARETGPCTVVRVEAREDVDRYPTTYEELYEHGEGPLLFDSEAAAQRWLSEHGLPTYEGAIALRKERAEEDKRLARRRHADALRRYTKAQEVREEALAAGVPASALAVVERPQDLDLREFEVPKWFRPDVWFETVRLYRPSPAEPGL